MRAVVIGAGAVGSRAARQVHSTDGVDSITIVDRDENLAHRVAESLGSPADTAPAAATIDALDGADVVLLCLPGGHRTLAEAALERGAHVVSCADAVGEVRDLLDLDAEARERAVSVVIGALFAPGLTDVLSRHAASRFDVVDEIHVASFGTGGPSCARQHHRALGGAALDYRDGAWVRRSGGSGRELCWFPDPVGGQDCYRASLPDALLLVPAFAGVRRVTARVAASRRDRISSWMPMLRPPHPEGTVGAVRVEVRGRRGTATDAAVLGAMDRPALAAGAVAAVASMWAAENRFTRPGAAGLAELVGDAAPFLRELARRGVKAAAFEGAG